MKKGVTNEGVIVSLFFLKNAFLKVKNTKMKKLEIDEKKEMKEIVKAKDNLSKIIFIFDMSYVIIEN